MQLQFQEDFHFKICELAALSSFATKITLIEFFNLKELLESGLSLKAAISSLAPSKFRQQFESTHFEEAQQAVEQCVRKDYQVIYPGHEIYPEEFLFLDKPPLFLSYIGVPAWLTKNRISVVGSREMSQDTVEWMELYFDLFLKKTKAVTISGAAYGIDQLAHRLSVRNGLPSIAFLPSGLNQIYPRKFSYDIENLIQARGVVVSEFLPQIEMKKHHFERRNRLISGLSEILFIAQARRKSGSMITARLALAQNKNICVLPSSPMQAQNLGNIDLLFDGAQPLRDEKDLIALWNREVLKLA